MLEAAGSGRIAPAVGLCRCNGHRSDKGVIDVRIVVGEDGRKSGDLGAYAMPEVRQLDRRCGVGGCQQRSQVRWDLRTYDGADTGQGVAKAEW